MSVSFSDRELALMREDQSVYLPELVTIKRRSLTSDGFGGNTTGADVVIATGVPARITQAQVQQTGGQLSRDLLLEKWTVRMPYDTPVNDEDRIHWTDEYGETRIIEVEDVKPRSFNTLVSIMGELVK